jgi:hypothetical protein
MRCARALPIQLMPAASSRSSPVATNRCWVDFPQRMSGRTPFASPHVGHPINHHVAGPSPVDPGWAPARPTTPTPTTRSGETTDDLTHNVFALVPGPAKFTADPRRPRGRSSSLRSGRSTSTATAVHRPRHGGRNQAQYRNNQRIPPFTGGPQRVDLIAGADVHLDDRHSAEVADVGNLDLGRSCHVDGLFPDRVRMLRRARVRSCRGRCRSGRWRPLRPRPERRPRRPARSARRARCSAG